MMLMQQAPTILKYLQGPNNVTSVAGDMTIPLGKNHITEAIDNGYDLGWMENTAKAIGGEALNKGLGLSEIYDPQGHTFTDGFPSDTFDNTPAKMSAEVFKNALDNGAKPVLPPTTEPWGQRTCYIADPDGNLIEIGSFVKQ